MDDESAPLFRLFWESSKLNARTAPAYGRRLDEDGGDEVVPRLFYPAAPRPLPRPTDALAAAMEARASRRVFAPAPLDERQLGSLFHAFAHRPRRLLPSAGGKHPIEVFALLFRVRGPLDGKVVYYDGDAHGLVPIANCPAWEAIEPAVGLPLTGAPAALFLFVALPERTTARYGERGGRFVLIEAGQHAQSLALRVAAEGLAGVEAGGVWDDPTRALLGLADSGAAVVLGYAIGVPG